jgi:hypothetical protein
VSVNDGGRPPVRVRGARTYSNQAGSVSDALRTAADHILLHEHQNPGNVTCDAFSLWFDPQEWVWCVGYTLEGCADETPTGADQDA